MKVTLQELRNEARRVFGETADVQDSASSACGTALVIFVGDAQTLSIYGKSRMGARRNALEILRRLPQKWEYKDE